MKIVILIVVVVAAAFLFTPVGERPLTALFVVGDADFVDFAELKLSDNANQFLMCPSGFCTADPHADSPVFDVSLKRLRTRWREVVAAQPRVELLAEAEDGRQLDYIQRSARLRFPDIITVRFISASPSKSTLAIYSRSIYGSRDFGVNRARIDAWLSLLREAL